MEKTRPLLTVEGEGRVHKTFFFLSTSYDMASWELALAPLSLPLTKSKCGIDSSEQKAGSMAALMAP